MSTTSRPPTAAAAPAASPPGDAAAAPAPRPPTRVLLVRHALTDMTGPRLAGRLPGVDLSERGREQAGRAARRLAALPVAAVYSSPIERATQTAAAIAAAHGLAVVPLPGVLEADFGEWTGGAIADLAQTDGWKVVQVAPSRARFPGGESIREMQARTVAALEHVVDTHPHEQVVVVSHADPIKAAVAHFTGLHLDHFQRLVIEPASVTVLEFHSYGVALVKCNDTGDLDGLRAPASAASDGSSGG